MMIEDIRTRKNIAFDSTKDQEERAKRLYKETIAVDCLRLGSGPINGIPKTI